MKDMTLKNISEAIEDALGAGGVELEIYRRPGFTGGLGVRKTETFGTSGSGIELGYRDEGTIWDIHMS